MMELQYVLSYIWSVLYSIHLSVPPLTHPPTCTPIHLFVHPSIRAATAPSIKHTSNTSPVHQLTTQTTIPTITVSNIPSSYLWSSSNGSDISLFSSISFKLTAFCNKPANHLTEKKKKKGNKEKKRRKKQEKSHPFSTTSFFSVCVPRISVSLFPRASPQCQMLTASPAPRRALVDIHMVYWPPRQWRMRSEHSRRRAARERTGAS